MAVFLRAPAAGIRHRLPEMAELEVIGTPVGQGAGLVDIARLVPGQAGDEALFPDSPLSALSWMRVDAERAVPEVDPIFGDYPLRKEKRVLPGLNLR